jgi:threonine/homoserine/homoserine lactone efflux protein
MLFFLSVLPQVASGATGQPLRLLTAIATYCAVLIVIHGCYAGLAARATTWLARPRRARLLSRLSAVVFFAFGAAMLTATA